MSKAPATVQKPTEFIGKLETTEEDSSANVSSLRDEFQVEIILFCECFILSGTYAI